MSTTPYGDLHLLLLEIKEARTRAELAAEKAAALERHCAAILAQFSIRHQPKATIEQDLAGVLLSGD